MNIKLKSGKEISVNNGILGIEPKAMKIYGGYDGEIFLTEWVYDDRPVYTRDELIEIADMAIERWQVFKQYVALGFIPVIGDKKE